MSQLILKDIDSSQRCGTDYKYEDLYLLIEQEIDKNNSVTQDSTDWNYIYTQSKMLLENETKDLKLAIWWLFASWKNYSWEGLEKNLPILIEFITIFNTDMFPKSPKSKINILFWLDEALTKEIIHNEKIKTITKHKFFYELFIDYQNSTEKYFDDKNKRFTKIMNYLKPFYDEEKKKEVEEKKGLNKIINYLNPFEKNKEEKVDKQIEVNYKENIFEILNDTDAIKALSTLKKNASMLSKYYRNKDFKDLKALRIARFLSWIDTDGLPSSDKKKTFLHPPLELEIDELNKLFKDENYHEALCLAEEIIEVSPFWLDGHYMVFNIFEKTNNKTIANEIKNSLLNFVKTNEGISDYYFQDNTPFASNKVKSWIKENDSSNNIITETKNTSSLENDINLIYELANNSKLKEAMQEITKNYEKSIGIEDKFNWRLIHAQLAIEFEKKDIALALLEELQDDIKNFKLDKWNPKLASKVYTLVLNSFSNTDIPQEKLEILYKKLCKIDINSAFEIQIN